jgi:hypothetical protein
MFPVGRLSAVHAAPLIPTNKLASARKSFGNGMGCEEVVLLLDDTFLGGSERGALATNERVAIATRRHRCILELSSLEHISLDGRSVDVHGEGLVQFDYIDESELREFFSVLSEFAHCAAMPTLDAPSTTRISADALARICEKHMGPEAFTGHSCDIGTSMAREMDAACHFLLGLPDGEQVAAICWLTPYDKTDCFAVTTHGIYSKVDRNRTSFTWDQLKNAGSLDPPAKATSVACCSRTAPRSFAPAYAWMDRLSASHCYSKSSINFFNRLLQRNKK